MFDGNSGDITCVCVLGGSGVGFGSQRSRERRATRQFKDGSVGFFPTKVAVCKFARTYLSMLWSSITDVFHVDTNCQQSLVVKQYS